MAQPSHRERLIDGALECLRTKGYGNTTARDIATAAGGNLASITYHFGSKEALLNEALLRVSERWTEQLGALALAQPNDDPLGQLATAYEATKSAFGGSARHRALFAALLEAIARTGGSPTLRKQLADYHDTVRAIIAQLVRASIDVDHELRPVDADALASFLVAVYDGLAIQMILDPGRVPSADRLIESLKGAIGSARA